MRRHRRIVVFRLVSVILSPGAAIVGPLVFVIVVLIDRRFRRRRRSCRGPCRRGGCRRGEGIHWNLVFVAVIIIRVILRK